MTNRSRIQIHFHEFGTGPEIPMAFPPETTLHDLKSVARNLLNEGKARQARLVDTTTGETLWLGQWTLTTSES